MSALKARPKARRRTASSTKWRRAVIQTPRPGNRRLRSGTTAPSGPTTKRMSSPIGRTSRVAMHNRSLAAAAACGSRSVTVSVGELCMCRVHLGRLLGVRLDLLGSCVFGSELCLRDPAGSDARLHDDHFAFLACQLEAIEEPG